MRAFRGLDVSAYGRAFALLFRFPQVMVGPVLAGIVSMLLFEALPGGFGGEGLIGQANASILGIVEQMIQGLGLALALAVADAAWRRNSAPLDRAWDDVTRRIGDVFFAVLGYGFVIFLAGLIGGFLGAFGALALTLVAAFFFVYTLAAATIGGIPGGAALQVSLERARDNPAPTLLLTIVAMFLTAYAPSLIVGTLAPLLLENAFLSSSIVSSLLIVVLRTLFGGYFALVLAKVYADLSFGRRW